MWFGSQYGRNVPTKKKKKKVTCQGNNSRGKTTLIRHNKCKPLRGAARRDTARCSAARRDEYDDNMLVVVDWQNMGKASNERGTSEMPIRYVNKDTYPKSSSIDLKKYL